MPPALAPCRGWPAVLHFRPFPWPIHNREQDTNCIPSDAAIFPFGERDNGPNATADPVMRAWLYQARLAAPNLPPLALPAGPYSRVAAWRFHCPPRPLLPP